MNRTAKRTIIALLAGTASVGGLGMLAGWSNAERSVGAHELVLEARGAERVYEADAVHSSVIFQIRHGGVSNFYGRFNDMKGEIHFDAAKPESSRMAFTVQTASVDTNNSSRDGHLKNADFFNARQFSEITFESTGLRKTSGGYELSGDLTLQGETRPVTATVSEFTAASGNGKDLLGFEARFSIKRSEFGMTKYLAPDNGEGGALGNTVELIVAVEAVAG